MRRRWTAAWPGARASAGGGSEVRAKTQGPVVSCSHPQRSATILGETHGSRERSAGREDWVGGPSIPTGSARRPAGRGLREERRDARRGRACVGGRQAAAPPRSQLREALPPLPPPPSSASLAARGPVGRGDGLGLRGSQPGVVAILRQGWERLGAFRPCSFHPAPCSSVCSGRAARASLPRTASGSDRRTNGLRESAEAVYPGRGSRRSSSVQLLGLTPRAFHPSCPGKRCKGC